MSSHCTYAYHYRSYSHFKGIQPERRPDLGKVIEAPDELRNAQFDEKYEGKSLAPCDRDVRGRRRSEQKHFFSRYFWIFLFLE